MTLPIARLDNFKKVPPFGDFPIPAGVEVIGIPAAVGTLTALHSTPRVPQDQAKPGGIPCGTVLIVPGFTGSKEDFLSFLPLLAEQGWNVWVYSQRGQADSAAPLGAENYSLEKQAADVVEVASLISPSPVHLLGHSLGGVIASAAAIASPSSFRSLTMFCSGPHGWPDRHLETTETVTRTGSLGLWERDNPELIDASDAELGPEMAFLRMRAAHTSNDNLLAGAEILRHHQDPSAALRGSGLPVLVTHGQDDEAWPQSAQRQMASDIGERAQYRVIPAGAHSPQLEAPQASAATLDAFWHSLAVSDS